MPTVLSRPETKVDAKLDSVEIVQAFSYHEFLSLATSDNEDDDGVGDGNDEGEERDDADNKEGDDDSNSGVGSDSGEPTIPLTKVGFEDALVNSTTRYAPRPKSGCANSVVRKGMFMNNPTIFLLSPKMRFLSRLEQLCIQAKVRHCYNKDCLELRKKLSDAAPQCDWLAFREWAIVSMSCQAAMNKEQKLSKAHTHLARTVSGFCMNLKRCIHKPLFCPFLGQRRIDLAGVSNVIYWMAKIQADMGIGPRFFGSWGHGILPEEVSLPAIEKASLGIEKMGLCKNRVWSLVNVSDRKQSDLPDIMAAVELHRESLGHKDHDVCTPSKCQWSQMNSTSIKQLHKRPCEAAGLEKPKEDQICEQLKFSVDLLETALELGKSTAWLCDARRLSTLKDPYIAVSHVWSDGTGVGIKDVGSVNSCLFNYFAGIAKELKCKAVWWDALSIPHEPKARSKALNKMHGNYASAAYTVVHDKYLLDFEFKGDGSPCLALVLSTWFTRGWTALELAMSNKVKVLFKGKDNKPDIRDLDDDILAKSPASASRTYWLVTSVIQRLRQPVHNVGDLLAILSPRSTSWVRDRTIIAGLLAGVPECDFTIGESLITQSILSYLGKIPYACLLHGKATMKDLGGYSWCASTLEDMPVDCSQDMMGSDAKEEALLEIDEQGAVQGYWYCRTISADIKIGIIRPYGNDLAAVVKIQSALRHQEHCLLLRPYDDQGSSDLALLVVPFSVLRRGPVLKCRYVGAVTEDRGGKRLDLKRRACWKERLIQIGGPDKGETKMKAATALKTMSDLELANDDGQSDDEVTCPHDPEDEDCDRGNASDNEQATRWFEKNTTRPDQPLLVAEEEGLATSAELQSSHLFEALHRSGWDDTVRYLVNRGVDLTANQKENLAKELGRPSEEIFYRTKMLGDAYTASNKLEDAMEMYKTSVAGYNTMKEDEITDTLGVLEAYYALGGLYIKIARQKQLKGADRSEEAHQNLKDAEIQLRNVLERCDKKTMRREMKKAKQAAEAKAAEGKAVAKKRNQADGWLKVEMDTIAELTLLYADQDKFEAAAEAFKKSLEIFGKGTPDAIEAFLVRWEERSNQPFEFKGKRDENAADTYQKALKGFDIMFKKNHLIIMMTALSLGINLHNRAKFREAEDQFRRALAGFENILGLPEKQDGAVPGCESVMTLLALYHLGKLLTGQHEYDEAKEMLQRSKSGFEQTFGRDSDLTLAATFALGQNCMSSRKPQLDEAEKHLCEVISGLERKTEHPWLRLLYRAKLGICEVSWSRWKAHKRTQSEANAEDEAQARRWVRSCDEIRRDLVSIKKTNPHDSDECEVLLFLSRLYEDQNDRGGATATLESCLQAFKYLDGEENISYLRALKRLSSLKQKLGENDEAEKLLRDAAAGFEKTLGAFHTDTLRTELRLGCVRLSRGELKDAEKSCNRAYQGFEKSLGPKARSTAEAAQRLGDVYMELGQFTKAKETYSKAYKGFKKSKGVDGKETLLAQMDYGKACAALGDENNNREAEFAYNQALKGFTESNGQDHSLTLDVRLRLGEVFRQQKKYKRAEQLILSAISGYSKLKLDSKSTTIFEAKLTLAHLTFDQLQDGESTDNIHSNEIEGLIKEARDGLIRLLGNDDLLSLDASALLGEFYLTYRDASTNEGETILKAALDTCCAKPTAGHPMTIRILDRLIHHLINDATDRKDEVKKLLTVKRDQLKRAHGPDYAATVLLMTNPMRTKRERANNETFKDYEENYGEGIEDIEVDDSGDGNEREKEDDVNDDDDRTDWGSDWDS